MLIIPSDISQFEKQSGGLLHNKLLGCKKQVISSIKPYDLDDVMTLLILWFIKALCQRLKYILVSDWIIPVSEESFDNSHFVCDYDKKLRLILQFITFPSGITTNVATVWFSAFHHTVKGWFVC